MNEHLYTDLIEVAKRLKISFWVEHFDDCHVLHVTHHLTQYLPQHIVRFVLVKYPHKGGCRIVQHWTVDDEIADFLAAFDEHKKRIPLQPCDEFGYGL